MTESKKPELSFDLFAMLEKRVRDHVDACVAHATAPLLAAIQEQRGFLTKCDNERAAFQALYLDTLHDVAYAKAVMHEAAGIAQSDFRAMFRQFAAIQAGSKEL